MENIRIALEIMGKGMSGIFAATLVMILSVILLGKSLGEEEEKQDEGTS